MKISIRNFRGIAAADFNHEKITFIGGKNYQGKSSVALALAAAYTGVLVPIKNLLKSQIKRLVRDGAKNGYINVKDGESDITVNWPACELTAQGKPIRNISEISAGLKTVFDFEKKKRTDLLAGFIKATPTDQDLERELRAANIDAATIAAVVKSVMVSGYNTTWAKAAEKGTMLKGQWQMITGEQYGSRKAESWAPAAYYPELGAKDPAALAEHITKLRGDVEAGIAAAAVSGQAVGELRKAAGSLDALRKDLNQVNIDLARLRGDFNKHDTEFRRLSATPEEQACPHCGGILAVVDGKIVEHKGLTDAEISDRTTAIRETSDLMEKARADVTGLIKRQANVEAGIKTAETAAAELVKLEKGGGAKKWDQNLEDVKAQLAKAETDLKAKNDLGQASRLALAIKLNKLIVDILGPDGLRKTKLNQAITPFNQLLSDLCVASFWQTLRMDTDYNFYMNDRQVELCSESEKFQAATILQLAVSKFDNARLVIIDRADIIVGKDRNGLFSAILKADVPAIIFMSLPDSKNLPAMEKIGGAALWIEKGEIING